MLTNMEEKPITYDFITEINGNKRSISYIENPQATTNFIITVGDGGFSLRFNEKDKTPQGTMYAHLNFILGLALYEKIEETYRQIHDSISIGKAAIEPPFSNGG